MIGLALLLSVDPAQASDAVRRYALLVGANDGGGERVSLRYAHTDADSMGSVLTELGGVDVTDRTVLYDPSAKDLRTALDTLHDAVSTSTERAEVFFYYSGHSDEEGLLLGEDRYPYADLRSSLEAVPADVRVAILDSCSSGAMIRTKGGRRVAPFLFDQSNDMEGFAYLTSSAADEVSQEAEQVGGSYFTHSLATGLRGAADQSGDGRVTLDEAYSFAYQTTLAFTERTQFGPQHANRANYLSGKGNLVITDLHLTSASLALDEDLAGRALVRDSDGDLVAELIKPEGRVVELGLGAGTYEITFGRRSDGRYALAQVQLEVGTTAIVGPDDLVWYDGEEAVARGDAPVATVAAAEPEKKRRTLRFELAPGVPPAPRDVTDSLLFGVVTRSKAIDGLAFALAATLVDDDLNGTNFALGTSIVGGNVDGAQTSLGFNLARGQARGAQITLGGNIAGGDLNGAQLSLGGNWVRGQANGGQLSLGINVADRSLRGLQGTLGGNVVVGQVEGIQWSLGANVATQDATGIQSTVGVNVVGGQLNGFQGSVGANVAGDVNGMQATVGANVAQRMGGFQLGGINVARDVRGTQVGLVNVGRHVRGFQLGLVNVARKIDGVAIGLLTFEREGRHDLLVYSSETDLLNADFKLGSRYFHTIFGLGGQPGNHAWLGLGWGAHIPISRLWLDIDGIAQSYIQPSSFVGDNGLFRWPGNRPVSFVTRGRLTVGAQIAKQLAVFAGTSIAVQPFPEDADISVAPSFAVDTPNVRLWPGVFAGVQF
ncbi:MAG: caspase family protein [Myxococcota bacterium]